MTLREAIKKAVEGGLPLNDGVRTWEPQMLLDQLEDAADVARFYLEKKATITPKGIYLLDSKGSKLMPIRYRFEEEAEA